jgi:HK97 family phage major capsid protein
MSKRPLQGLMAEIKQLSESVANHFDMADREERELSAPEREQVKDWNKKIEELEVKASELIEIQGLRTTNDQRREQFKAGTTSDQPRGGNQRNERMSIGDQLFADEAFKAWQETISARGRIGEKEVVTSPGVQVKDLITGASATSGGAFVVNERTNIVDGGTFMRELSVLDLISSGTTGSDAVEFVQMTGFTNNAAETAEATSVANGAKPESAITMAVVQAMVKNIAHWIPITRRALADAAQIRTWAETLLRYGLKERLAEQVLTGDGLGENLTGILSTVGTQSQAWDTDILTTTRKARTKVRTVGRANPNGYVMHPNDWQTIDLLQDNEARYFFGGPSALGTPRLWGLPVVEDEGMTEGTSVVADWRLAMLWNRQQETIYITDSHSDYFTRNILVMLAEMRAAFGVIRPSAFVEIDLTS